MSEPVYAIAPRARAAMVESARRAKAAFKNGIYKNGLWYKITLEQAQKMYREEVMQILRSCHVQVDPDSPVAIQCGNCRKVTMVARDVKVFRCHCSPHEEQWSCKSWHVEGVPTRVIDA